jgi:nicotinamide-nucleotide amidase
VSEQTAKEMALGAKCALRADVAVSVTGLAGPGGDEFGNPVGTVYIGYADEKHVFAQKHNFPGDRDEVRAQAVKAALQLILELNG